MRDTYKGNTPPPTNDDNTFFSRGTKRRLTKVASNQKTLRKLELSQVLPDEMSGCALWLLNTNDEKYDWLGALNNK